MNSYLINIIHKSRWLEKKEYLILLMLFCGAIAFRLVLMINTYAVGFDEVNYLKLAADARLNGIKYVLHPYWPPFLPIIVALFSYIIPNFEIAGRFSSILINAVLIFPCYVFVKKHIDRRTAYLVASLVAFYSMYAGYSVHVETEAIYTMLAISGIFLGWSALNQRKPVKSFLVGILFGGAYLTRPEGIGFLIVFIGLTFLIALCHFIKKSNYRSYVPVMLFVLVGFTITAFPYLNYLRKETGGWTLSAKGLSNQLGEMYLRKKAIDEPHPFHVLRDNNTRLIEDEIYHIGNFIANMKHETQLQNRVSFLAILKKIGWQNYQIITKEFLKVFSLPTLIIIVLGLFSVPWSRKNVLVDGYLLSYLLFFWFLLIPSFHITIRYFIPLVPIAFIWLVKGGFQMHNWLKVTLANITEIHWTSGLLSKLSAVIVIIVICGGAILPDFAKHMKRSIDSIEEWSPAIEQKKAGIWLKRNGVKSPIVMAYNHAVSFYAGNFKIAESVEIPKNEAGPLIEYAKHRKVNYIVLNTRYQHRHPLISHLYQGREIPIELKQIYYDRERNGLETRIYKVLN